MIRVLFGCGNLLTETDHAGRTALHIAVRHSNLQVLQTLCDCSSDAGFLDQKDNEGVSALLIAVKLKKVQMVKLLLKTGANPNSTDRFLATSLHHAVHMGSTALVRVLLVHRAGMYLRDSSSYTPLLLSASKNPNTFICFARHADFQEAGRYMKSDMGYAITHLAFKAANFDLLRLLLDLDIWDVNTPDSRGDTLLHSAARDGRANLVELLLQMYRASANVRNIDSQTPMDLAREAVYPRPGGNALGLPLHDRCVTLLMACHDQNVDSIARFCASNKRSIEVCRSDMADDVVRMIFDAL